MKRRSIQLPRITIDDAERLAHPEPGPHCEDHSAEKRGGDGKAAPESGAAPYPQNNSTIIGISLAELLDAATAASSTAEDPRLRR